MEQIETEYLSNVTKPLVGYLCLRVPVELIEACGAVPVRITSQPDANSDGYTSIRTDACSFCRNVASRMNSESFNHLQAIIIGACCDQMRRLAETLGDNLKVPVIFYGSPRTYGCDKSYFLTEMKNAFRRLGKAIGNELNNYELKRYIHDRNRLRNLVNNLRDLETLPGALLHKIAATPLPAEMVTEYLSGLNLETNSGKDIRLMLLGSIPSGKELTVIEEMGGRVVADATCLGDRVFILPKSSAESDPIEFLYQHYIEDNLCPHRRPYTRLIEYVKGMIDRRKVDGIIYRSVKFCHPYGLAAMRFKSELKVPFLQLDDDLTLQAISSFRTRIGAFIEMLEARKRDGAVVSGCRSVGVDL